MSNNNNKGYESISIYPNCEVAIEEKSGFRYGLNRRTFRKHIYELPDGQYAFTGAPRYRYPGAKGFHFSVENGNVLINKALSENPPIRDIADLEELAEIILEESTPEGKPYGLNPYGSDGHPNYHGLLVYL